jgi:hypothetical protein
VKLLQLVTLGYIYIYPPLLERRDSWMHAS